MVRWGYLVDDLSLRIALDAGQVFLPRAERDPDSGDWVVVARCRQGGADWVLTRDGCKAGFPCLEQAWREADRLRSLGGQHPVGRRQPRPSREG